MRTPFELSEDQFAAKVDALGAIDVLCSHIPPAVPELTYDVVARRFEKGSTALVRLIETIQPRWALFGHVHQPLAARRRIGRTECVNVGHFRANGAPFALEW
jgi:Icc-related predicted phosphoesterase